VDEDKAKKVNQKEGKERRTYGLKETTFMLRNEMFPSLHPKQKQKKQE
jgi:hypothetical protein